MLKLMFLLLLMLMLIMLMLVVVMMAMLGGLEGKIQTLSSGLVSPQQCLSDDMFLEVFFRCASIS